MNPEQKRAAAALLRARIGKVPAAIELGRLFARAGHELALVGGPVRDIFLGEQPGDLDLTTDATPEQVLALTEDWADATWTVGIGVRHGGAAQGQHDVRDNHLPQRAVRGPVAQA